MVASPPRPDPAKSALRRAARNRRAARSPEQLARAGRLIADVGLELPRLRRAGRIAVYASVDGEPVTGPLRGGLLDLGVQVLLPIVAVPPADRAAGTDRSLNWALDTGELTASGPFGLSEPSGQRLGTSAISTADVVIVPALGVDTRGTRLGRGRAYYDTALALADPGALVLALVFDDELLDGWRTPIPREPHDVPVHGMLTPSRWMLFG